MFVTGSMAKGPRFILLRRMVVLDAFVGRLINTFIWSLFAGDPEDAQTLSTTSIAARRHLLINKIICTPMIILNFVYLCDTTSSSIHKYKVVTVSHRRHYNSHAGVPFARATIRHTKTTKQAIFMISKPVKRLRNFTTQNDSFNNILNLLSAYFHDFILFRADTLIHAA